ncbi:hypothetical protein SLS60_000296 [Paraconiothyrium brasiliense]|uniref:Uncharacterized protein n=1 Tax=Paraconiothyrium brasiliense TaxID=300254 RepID=A0ABR3S6M3_9PLEO
MASSNGRSSQSIRRPLASIPLNTVPHDRADSASTICDDGTGFQYTPTSSAPESHEDLFTQLLHASGSKGDQAPNTPDSPASSSTTSGYASDRTDFIFDEPNTPCPTRNFPASHQRGITSSMIESYRQNPMRQPDFGRTTFKQPPRQSQRAPEYTVRHQWTNKQRYDLAVLYKFFKADAEILSKVFNHMHNLNLDARKQVKPQEKFLRDNVDAFTFCLKISNCPISDPNDDFSSDRAAVEEAARSIGIELERREVESNQSSGSARSARSKYTRRRFKELLRRSRFKDNSSPGNERRPHVYTDEIRFGGFAISPNNSEEMEVVVNDKGASLTTKKLKTSPSQCSPQSRLHQVELLAFRVWDQNRYLLVFL